MDAMSMLREDRAAWDELVAVLEAHPNEVLHDPASSWRWTSRDVYAHLARWLTRSMDELEAALAGAPLAPLDGTDDEINARWQREDGSLSLEEARARAQAAFDRRIRLVESVAGDRWDGALERIARYDGAEHYRAHLSYIVVVKKERGRPSRSGPGSGSNAWGWDAPAERWRDESAPSTRGSSTATPP